MANVVYRTLGLEERFFSSQAGRDLKTIQEKVVSRRSSLLERLAAWYYTVSDFQMLSESWGLIWGAANCGCQRRPAACCVIARH